MNIRYAIQKLPRDGAYFAWESFDFLFPPSGQRTQWIVNGWAWDATNAKSLTAWSSV